MKRHASRPQRACITTDSRIRKIFPRLPSKSVPSAYCSHALGVESHPIVIDTTVAMAYTQSNPYIKGESDGRSRGREPRRFNSVSRFTTRAVQGRHRGGRGVFGELSISRAVRVGGGIRSLCGGAIGHAYGERPAAARGRDEARDPSGNPALQAGADGHEARM